jgi:hypothetical protein
MEVATNDAIRDSLQWNLGIRAQIVRRQLRWRLTWFVGGDATARRTEPYAH